MPHVTFIHGIANKPKPDRLLRIWDAALKANDGLDLGANGVTMSMIYWADVLYAAPEPERPGVESNESKGTMPTPARPDEIDMTWLATASPEEKKLVEGVAAEVAVKSGDPAAAMRAELSAVDPGVGAALERIPLPWFIKQPIMRTLLRDVHHYLFNYEFSPRPGATYRVRDEIRRRTIDAIAESSKKSPPHVVVSHSMGTVIAYDCLKRVVECARVDGLMTIGSPLGIDEVQDKLHPENGGPGWDRRNGFPSAKVGGGWTNVYDRVDPVVGFDPQFANDFERDGERIVRDINEQNYGAWRHNISHYLGGAKLRAELAALLDL